MRVASKDESFTAVGSLWLSRYNNAWFALVQGQGLQLADEAQRTAGLTSDGPGNTIPLIHLFHISIIHGSSFQSHDTYH